MKELLEIVQEIENDANQIIKEAKLKANEISKNTEKYIEQMRDKEMNEAILEANKLEEQLNNLIREKEKKLLTSLEKEKQILQVSDEKISKIVDLLIEDILSS